ncbi:MAG: DUF3365 domain-containing protein [Elusimicrobia bacterium]|nr:DUF3365 domain-containing protein [Elusimicrobiota bacterium]
MASNPSTSPVQVQTQTLESGERDLRRLFFLLPLCWTVLILVLLTLHHRHSTAMAVDMAVTNARDTFSKDLVNRHWAAGHGGVYVPVTPQTQPNPYLKVPERDVTTTSGRKLTLINPAYMMRQIQELGKDQYGLRAHITSLRPIRPLNAPDDWEKTALKSFEKGAQEASSLEQIDGKTYLRFMAPFITEASCLKCHAAQGYKPGDIRGGLSVSVPWEHVKQGLAGQLRAAIAAYGTIWAVGLLGLWLSSKQIRHHLSERRLAHARTEALVVELTAALGQVKTLSGFIPICASCKKVRNDKGFWESVEKYVTARSDAQFSHGVCPDCGKRLYGAFYDDEAP